MKQVKITVNLYDLTIDTGYGDADAELEADCILHFKPAPQYDTPSGSVMGEVISEVEIESCTIWEIDQDGGSSEYANDVDRFEDLIKEEAKELYLKRLTGGKS